MIIPASLPCIFEFLLEKLSNKKGDCYLCLKIASVSTYEPPFSIEQSNLELLTRELFHDKYQQLDRLLKIFENGDIKTRQFCVPTEWYKEEHTFEERNSLYIELATKYSVEAIKKVPSKPQFS